MRRGGLLVGLLIVGAVLLTDARNVRADTVIATVPVGTTPNQIQLTPDGNELFVSNEASNTVSVISTITDGVIATVPVGTDPGPIRFTPNGAKAYVANVASNNVSVIDAAIHAEIRRTTVGTNPVTLSRSDDGTKVYVANAGSNTVSVISTTTDTVTKTIDVGTKPNTMAKTPDGTKLYVANELSDNVSVISTGSDSVVATISVSSVLPQSADPGSIHFLLNGTKAYVANRGCVSCIPQIDPTVSVINVQTNSVIKNIDVGSPGDAPHAMRITPTGNKLYLVNKHGDEVVVIDTVADTVLGTINQFEQGSCSNPVPLGIGSCPVRIELTPDGSKAYILEERPLAASGKLTAICTGVVPSVCGGASTDTVVGTVSVGGSPVDMEMKGASKVYVSNSASTSHSVSVVMLGDIVPGADSDGDGCTDARELGSDPTHGGQRNPTNPWDFYDVAGPGGGPKDKYIDFVNDVLGVAFRYTPGGGTYDAAYDRSHALGAARYQFGPPDGVIDFANDILGVAFQYQHDCQS